MNHQLAGFVVASVFANALKQVLVETREAQLDGDGRKLSEMEPIPWSRQTFDSPKSVLNLIPCDNEFEYDFAKFLHGAVDVRSYCKLPESFGFAIEYTDNNANLRYYYPDFVAKADDGMMWLIETKGQESVEVAYKDRAAQLWCANASALTGQQWHYVKVPQKEYEKLQPIELSDLLVFAPPTLEGIT